MKLFCLSLSCWVQLSAAQQATGPADLAVIGVMQKADAGAQQFHLLRREPVDSRLDVVVVAAESGTLGLFMQERLNAGRVYTLAIQKGEDNCEASVERITPTEAIVSCGIEKYQRLSYRKFIYDARARTLVRQLRYAQFSGLRIFADGEGAVFVESDGGKMLAVRYASGEFQILNDAAGRPWIARAAEAPVAARPLPALPHTTYDEFARARPKRVQDGYKREGTEIHDAAGPWRKENARVWFGKSFYDGEGSTGVGGFGYLDSNDHKLRMFAPPEIADWSVTAMAVEPAALWMGLAWLGEGSTLSGGILRFDRLTERVRHFECRDVPRAIEVFQGQVLIASDFGIGLLKGGRITRYFIDPMSGGSYRIVEGPAAEPVK